MPRRHKAERRPRRCPDGMKPAEAKEGITYLHRPRRSFLAG